MVSGLDDMSILQDKNEGGVLNGGKTMGDDDAGMILHHLVEGIGDELLCSGIDIAGCFIQYDDIRFKKHDSCDGEHLALALGEAFLGRDLGIITEGKGIDEGVGMGLSAGLPDFFVTGIRFGIADVFHDCSREDPGFLQDHAEVAAKG